MLALVFLLGQAVLRVLFLQLRLQIGDGVTGGVELGLLGGRVDLYQQVAFLDLGAGLDVNLADLPGGLRADIDVTPRLQGAQGRHAALDIAPVHLQRGKFIPAGRDQLPGGKGRHGDQAKCCQQSAPGVSRTVHARVPARKVRTAAQSPRRRQRQAREAVR